ncbi:MAG TPA: sporulation protein YqfD [Desulfobacteria bacterium]|nr:sporulation protein YqfD [Desulfobacteria bacterium]
MLLGRVKEFLFGSLRVIAKGDRLDKFINLANRKGIEIWQVRYVNPKQAVFCMHPDQFHRLRSVVRHSGLRLKIRRKSGLPFLLHKIEKRKGLITGFVLICLTIFIASRFVWFVEVKGNKKLSAQQVLNVAQELGIKPGIWRGTVDPTAAGRELKERMPQAAWVGVTVHGTKVQIELVEKVEPPAPKPGKGNLLAAKTGLVTDVLVIKGTPVVHEGQTVKKGQLLVSADSLPAAQGFVRARVWYSGVGTAKLKDEGVAPSGNTATSIRIKIGTKVIILTGKKSPFTLFKVETESKSLPQWRNIRIPVEILTVNYQEMKPYKKEFSKEQALKLATDLAMEKLTAKLPTGVKVINKRTLVETEKDSNIIRVRAEAETTEEIAVHQGA